MFDQVLLRCADPDTSLDRLTSDLTIAWCVSKARGMFSAWTLAVVSYDMIHCVCVCVS